jgi:photosystem II stability/assembly factor-like uncharacterized protein
MLSRRFVVSFAQIVLAGSTISIPAQESPQVSASLFAEMKWRSIGPLRASRTRAASGHRSQPYTFYAGAVNGGVWKTTDAGRMWQPIFDDQPTSSIGTIEVAPSDPNIIYVGSGEGLHRPDLSTGDGIYKSTDAGKTWTHLGLRDAQQIPAIAIDPRNPDRLFVAALGHPYGPNEERGIYRSADGGRTFQKVLSKDEDTGGNDVDIDPSNPNVVYATMWEERQGPWENAVWAGTNGGIFKSTDGGGTWTQLTQGLPTVVQANLAISPANPKRLFAIVAAYEKPGSSSSRGASGIYRSDDGGESWVQITTDNRPAARIGGGDLPVPIAHPTNPDIVIIASTVSWKSIDGGKTWVPFKGAPGGEDYQNGWINPDNPDIILLAADQGAVVSLNGGETWSSWYNQPTAALYHVSADNAFPYRVCSGQQESGSACVASRGNYGAISDRDWLPVGVDEYGYVAPDPLDPDIVYGGRSVTRFNRRTGQVSTVGPVGGRGGVPGAPGNYRQVRTMPVVFSEVDRRTLFFANNVLWKTIDGGIHWTKISPDLTRETWEPPKSIGKYLDQPDVRSSQRGVIYTVAPSYKDINHIWVGTDDGLIHVTADGGATWRNVTPPALSPWAKVSVMDAGRFDPLTAYAAVNTIRLDDLRPHIFCTHDGGKTWTEIARGIPAGETVNAVREDPKRKGLLFAGTERGVYVSFDDGNAWRSLRLNMPSTSVRDIIVKDDDLVAATHGRGFWILDDITPLRQIQIGTADEDVVLFKPTTAWRVRWNTSTDMPWPKEEPTGTNTLDGAIINYYLRSNATDAVTLEIVQQDGRVVRRYSSTDAVIAIPDPPNAPWPVYWYRPPQRLATTTGMHRFLWDVHYQPLATGSGAAGLGTVPTQLPIQAIPYNSPTAATTPWVAPGTYTVKLTVNGRPHTQPIVVKQDPRVKTPAPTMQQVYTLTKSMYFGAADAQNAAMKLSAIRDQLTKLQAQGATAQAIAAFEKKAAALEGTRAGGRGGRGGGLEGGGRGRAGRGETPPQAGGQPAGAGRGATPSAGPVDTLWGLSSLLSGLMNAMQAADVAPTANTLAAVTAAQQDAARVMAQWNALHTVDLPALNASLRGAGLAAIELK